MAIDFTGTNTEKTDKLIAAVVEQRTTLRLFLAAVGLGLPLIIGLQVSVVVESFRSTAKLDRLADKVDRLAEQQAATQTEVKNIQADVQRLGGRIDRLEQRVTKP